MNFNVVDISVICPVLNEKHHIKNLLDFFLNSSPSEKELFLIDGGSTDGTLEYIHDITSQYSNIFLLHNRDKYVPFALNMAIPLCKGRFIVRLDAHCDYEIDYFDKIKNTFLKSRCDIVGGPTRTRFNTNFQESVAVAICDSFAIGNSLVHNINYEGLSDSVTFGAWNSRVFEKTGLFDTDLIRNQDDEFHYRAQYLGFRIYQDPEIKLYYYPRSTLLGLFFQYFQYGKYKPLVLYKVKSGIKVRHIIPSFFVIYLVFLIFLFKTISIIIIPFLFYILLCLYKFISLNISNLKSRLFILSVFPTIHIAYGLGFIRGLFFFKNLNRKT